MHKTAIVRARIEPTLKKNTEHLLHQLGLSVTQAITLFYKQIALRKGLPFDVAIPHQTTQKTFQDTDQGRHLTICKDADDMFDKLGI